MTTTAHDIGRSDHWMDARRDPETGIESLRAHFSGHAYDPHDHDDMLIGYTEQGVQRFQCHRSLHTSVPGRAILIEPGALHDGHAPEPGGFTYAMLYLPQSWVERTARRLELPGLAGVEAAFGHTLVDDRGLVDAIRHAFAALHGNEGRLARDQALDRLLMRLRGQLREPFVHEAGAVPPAIARVRDLLHARMDANLGLDELAELAGIDRFRLTRLFQRAFGTSPHAYLVRVRLRAARRLLAAGRTPAEAAADVGFADQSHLGRWFRRAYRITPAAYRRMCTNVPD
ncbi:AraC family transcriptional regulator [Burkholderia multivorans]|uniref:AraC family transcriptional regulator n=1 Tax=Burkholderia multivorans TaxID=87883 RepID=UPI000CFF9C3F|nr:AraC family transcriptional regulator [Burkholderia multivorans]MBR8451992.1 AraC family transcriptional regulator [Burkholderia multivorans]MBU9448011.1 AraC family transcriptional regulator [Burkholderia multivorans]MCL4643167.1 AraC family transcriptional regulator [Burkholderia multivorans]PRG41910.1 AraC family transcriptional regulator [Burkholderia multivorans]UQN86242.1 AraC family transcriptional regulator [Burkholderia multivorans]